MSEKNIVWFEMKLSPEQKRRIERLARNRGLSQKEAVLAAVEAALNGDPGDIVIHEPSFLDRYGKYCGAVEGPGDLNVNRRKYIQNYGRTGAQQR